MRSCVGFREGCGDSALACYRRSPLVFALLPLLSGLLPILNKPALESTRYVLLFLVYAILVMTGVDAILVITRASDVLPAGGATAAGFIEATLRLTAQQMLLLLAVGQILYLFHFIELTLEVDLKEKKHWQGDLEGWLDLGRRHVGFRQYAQARRAYQQALRLDPDQVEALVNLSGLRYLAGEYDAALEPLAQAVANSPFDADLRRTYADLLATAGRYQDAIGEYTHAVELDPQNVDYRVAEANLLNSLGRYEGALVAYGEALKIGGLTPAAEALLLRNKADLLIQSVGLHDAERQREALGDIEGALGRDPHSVRGWTIKGRVLMALGEEDNARAALEAALEEAARADGKDADDWSLVSDALLELRRYDEALVAIERAIAMEPGVGGYHYSRGHILLEMGRRDEEALREFDEALARALTPFASRLGADVYHLLVEKAKALRAMQRGEDAQAFEASAAALRGR